MNTAKLQCLLGLHTNEPQRRKRLPSPLSKGFNCKVFSLFMSLFNLSTSGPPFEKHTLTLFSEVPEPTLQLIFCTFATLSPRMKPDSCVVKVYILLWQVILSSCRGSNYILSAEILDLSSQRISNPLYISYLFLALIFMILLLLFYLIF